jgi:uncharacterized protein
MTSPTPVPVDGRMETLSRDACRKLLEAATVGRIAFVVDGLPCVLPVNYRLFCEDDILSLLLRTRPGDAIDNANHTVALEIDSIDHTHHGGWSVLVRGTLQHLDDADVERLSPRFDPKPWPTDAMTSWLAIRVRTISGRELHALEGEWAFSSEGYL